MCISRIDDNGNEIEKWNKKDNSLLVKYFAPSIQKNLIGKKMNDSIEFSLNDTFDDKLLPAILKDLDLDLWMKLLK